MTDQVKAISDTVEVQDLDHFIRLLFAWHENKVKTLEHMLEVPEGSEVVYQEGEAIVLEGDVRKGFIIGLTLGLMELGHLPFAAELPDDEDDAAKPTAQSANEQPTTDGAHGPVH